MGNGVGMSILLKGRNIEHSYREGKIVTPVLKGVNLDIQASRMTAIVGKSGSGKSTLLHILGTLDTPDKGEILFKNTEITSLNDRQKAHFRNRHLGFIYQFHHLLDDFSVLENVMLPLLIAHAERDLAKSRATYLLERVGLSDRLRYLPSELSGGERQRVAIARAMVHSPELILADEPTGNLDEGNAATVFELFRELVRDEKTAVVMVTHDLSLARQCDEILEMQGGLVLSNHPLQDNDLDDEGHSVESAASSADGEDIKVGGAQQERDARDEQNELNAYYERNEIQLKDGASLDQNNQSESVHSESKSEPLGGKSTILDDTSEVETIEEDGSAVIFLQHDGSNHALEKIEPDRK